MKSPDSLILIDQWDEGVFEKDIKTQLILDCDPEDKQKPVYIELNDMKGEYIIDSICIALSYEQAFQLSRKLMKMVYDKEWKDVENA
jgi:hypothetical protein